MSQMSQTGRANETSQTGRVTGQTDRTNQMTGQTLQTAVERLLFETGAIRVAPEDKPFWYTSGTLGPYYCNTHFLYGSEAAANELLAVIDGETERDIMALPDTVARHVTGMYEAGGCFREVADMIPRFIKAHTDVDTIDAISGGARRDWFFSFIAAYLLNKPHITINKDLTMTIGDAPPTGHGDRVKPVREGSLKGLRCLHVSDIITEASSYARAWAPALLGAGSGISVSLTILDRLQGGGAVLSGLGIEHLTLASIDAGLFDRALASGYINPAQHSQVVRYIADPNGTMREFLNAHPRFLSTALNAGGKDAARARLCVESGVYNI